MSGTGYYLLILINAFARRVGGMIYSPEATKLDDLRCLGRSLH
jgi:hypothetical protein